MHHTPTRLRIHIRNTTTRITSSTCSTISCISRKTSFIKYIRPVALSGVPSFLEGRGRLGRGDQLSSIRFHARFDEGKSRHQPTSSVNAWVIGFAPGDCLIERDEMNYLAACCDRLIVSSRYPAACGEVLHSKKCVTLRDSYFDKDKQRNATIDITPSDCGFG